MMYYYCRCLSIFLLFQGHREIIGKNLKDCIIQEPYGKIRSHSNMHDIDLFSKNAGALLLL